jgi:hypothetical protein
MSSLTFARASRDFARASHVFTRASQLFSRATQHRVFSQVVRLLRHKYALDKAIFRILTYVVYLYWLRKAASNSLPPICHRLLIYHFHKAVLWWQILHQLTICTPFCTYQGALNLGMHNLDIEDHAFRKDVVHLHFLSSITFCRKQQYVELQSILSSAVSCNALPDKLSESAWSRFLTQARAQFCKCCRSYNHAFACLHQQMYSPCAMEERSNQVRTKR